MADNRQKIPFRGLNRYLVAGGDLNPDLRVMSPTSYRLLYPQTHESYMSVSWGTGEFSCSETEELPPPPG